MRRCNRELTDSRCSLSLSLIILPDIGEWPAGTIVVDRSEVFAAAVDIQVADKAVAAPGQWPDRMEFVAVAESADMWALDKGQPLGNGRPGQLVPK